LKALERNGSQSFQLFPRKVCLSAGELKNEFLFLPFFGHWTMLFSKQ